jgi:hypothetical protein
MEAVYGRGRNKFYIRPNPDKNDKYWKAGFEFIKVFVDGSGFLFLHKNKLPKDYTPA